MKKCEYKVKEPTYMYTCTLLCIARTNTTVPHKSLNISAFLARRDKLLGMGDFFVSP